MPTYEYRCDACGHRFSRLYRSMSGATEAAAPPCPACGAVECRRTVSRVAALSGAPPAGTGVSGPADEGAKYTTREQIDTWRSGRKPG
jgi:putative FmdB family regulatory protein